MAVNIQGNQIVSTASKPSIDADYGPYTGSTLQEALNSAESALKYKKSEGKTIGIKVGTNSIIEYWYKFNNTNELSLTEKTPDLSSKQDIITNSNKLDADLVDDTNSDNKFVTSSEKTTWNSKQNVITSSNKLSADNIADGSTNKVVTQAEKTAWNGKQNALNNTQLANIDKGGTALQPSSTSGLLKNDGTIDTETQGKAANAIQMPSGATSDKVLGYANNAVAWVEKPSNGKSAYQIWYDENEYDDPTYYNEDYFLASLKAQFGSFVPAEYGTDGKPNDGTNDIPASADTTNNIYLVDNLASNPTAKTMWITIVDNTDPQNPQYNWTNIGDVRVNLTFSTGQDVAGVAIKDLDGEVDPDAQSVLSAEQGKELNERVVDIENKFTHTEHSWGAFPSNAITNTTRNIRANGTWTTQNDAEFILVSPSDKVRIIVDKEVTVPNTGVYAILQDESVSDIDYTEDANFSTADGFTTRIEASEDDVEFIVPFDGHILYHAKESSTGYNNSSVEKQYQEIVKGIDKDVEDLQESVDDIPTIKVDMYGGIIEHNRTPIDMNWSNMPKQNGYLQSKRWVEVATKSAYYEINNDYKYIVVIGGSEGSTIFFTKQLLPNETVKEGILNSLYFATGSRSTSVFSIEASKESFITIPEGSLYVYINSVGATSSSVTNYIPQYFAFVNAYNGFDCIKRIEELEEKSDNIKSYQDSYFDSNVVLYDITKSVGNTLIPINIDVDATEYYWDLFPSDGITDTTKNINSNGNWTSQYDAEIIAVSPGEKVCIFVDANYGKTGMCAVLQNIDDIADGTPAVCSAAEGFTTRFEKDGDFTFTVPNDGHFLYHAKENSQGFTNSVVKNGHILPQSIQERNIQQKAKQFCLTQWTCKGNIPYRGDSSNPDSPSSESGGTFSEGTTITGMPYSSVKEIDKYIGFDVSVLTFMTAVNNPYSLLYTENVSEDNSKSDWGFVYHGVKCATYYGTVCSEFSSYATGMSIITPTHSHKWLAEYAMKAVCLYNQTEDNLKIGDILVRYKRSTMSSMHCMVVVNIIRNANGHVTSFKVAESTGSHVRFKTRTKIADSDTTNIVIAYRFIELYKNIGYDDSANEFIDLSLLPNPTYSPSGDAALIASAQKTYSYNNDICTFAGDKACFAEGDLVVLNYNLNNDVNFPYTDIEVYKDDVLLRPYNIASIDQSELPATQQGHALKLGTTLLPGDYKARCKNLNSESEYTYFEVIDTSHVTIENDFIKNRTTINFSSTNGLPVCVGMTNISGEQLAMRELTDGEVLSGEIKSDFIRLYKEQNNGKTLDDSVELWIKLYFKGKYGRVTAKLPYMNVEE